jgi:integrase
VDERQPRPEGYLTRSQAEEALRQFLVTESATAKAQAGATFDQVADAYVASLEARIRRGTFRGSTLRTYVNIIEKELRPLWGGRPIASITPQEVADYRARLVERELAGGTINQTGAIVHGIFSLAVQRFEVPQDVSLAFPRAKTRRATSDKISFYPPDEVMRLAEHAVTEQDATLLLTAAFTGLRASELRALRWRSVDFRGSLVHVERGYTDEGGEDLPRATASARYR